MIDAKSVSQLRILRDCLAPEGKIFDLAPGEEIKQKENSDPLTWFFDEGAFAYYREANDLLIDIVTAPTVFGLTFGIIPTQHEYRIVTEIACKGFWLSSKKVLECIEKNQLWQALAYWTISQKRMMETRDARFVGASTYAQIRSTLLTMATWEPELRNRIGVINFIQKRTHISRSVIAEVLAALRQGNYIEMNKGKLVNVTRLPRHY